MTRRAGTNKRVRVVLPDRTLCEGVDPSSNQYFAVSLAILVVIAGIGSCIYLYHHYSSLVTERVASGFWHSRGERLTPT